MATEMSRGNLFEPELVGDLINKVIGRSTLAILSGQKPIPFNGMKEFTFDFENEIDVVAENGKKSHGGVTMDSQTIVPIKVEYGARFSDEFLFAAEEEKLSILKNFNEGFAKKLAKGLDLMAFHGINPRTGTASAVIGDNHFDNKVTQTVIYNEADPDANVESAIAMIQGSDGEVSAMAMDAVFAAALAKLKVNGVRVFPELAWGGNPGSLNGLKTDINKTVYNATEKDHAILGDFANGFKWGYAKQIPLEVIKYGDPDNSGRDLKGYNQVYLRAEAYLGWGILTPNSFARVKEA